MKAKQLITFLFFLSLFGMKCSEVPEQTSLHKIQQKSNAQLPDSAADGEANPAHSTTDRETNQPHSTADRGEANRPHSTADRGEANRPHSTADRGEANRPQTGGLDTAKPKPNISKPSAPTERKACIFYRPEVSKEQFKDLADFKDFYELLFEAGITHIYYGTECSTNNPSIFFYVTAGGDRSNGDGWQMYYREMLEKVYYTKSDRGETLQAVLRNFSKDKRARPSPPSPGPNHNNSFLVLTYGIEPADGVEMHALKILSRDQIFNGVFAYTRLRNEVAINQTKIIKLSDVNNGTGIVISNRQGLVQAILEQLN